MILDLFPREVGPPRITVYSKKEMLDYINLYNGKKKAVYYSIYHFDRVENNKPKYDMQLLFVFLILMIKNVIVMKKQISSINIV